MFRDFTKSALSFSWALSLLTVKQAVNLVRPGQQPQGGDLFSPMTQVAVEQLDESMKGIYRSGDNMQARAVDMAFSWMNPGNIFNSASMPDMGKWANPSTWMSSMANMAQQATGAFGGCGNGQQSSAGPAGNPGGPGAPGAAPSGENSAPGWGPMPGDQ